MWYTLTELVEGSAVQLLSMMESLQDCTWVDVTEDHLTPVGACPILLDTTSDYPRTGDAPVLYKLGQKGDLKAGLDAEKPLRTLEIVVMIVIGAGIVLCIAILVYLMFFKVGTKQTRHVSAAGFGSKSEDTPVVQSSVPTMQYLNRRK
ncbi:hypothetical protein KIPB_005781 [Kipferlia bialata]|uniref:Uncharacterized protein n=1 Tax=Kipferlia bialata TaxID=797122 RepID=A0A9K3GJ69_9EUKA|nr:hypothetical protein KIPB_005781 [Kipferlia bialata]|eukprot:g5781.t1